MPPSHIPVTLNSVCYALEKFYDYLIANGFYTEDNPCKYLRFSEEEAPNSDNDPTVH